MDIINLWPTRIGVHQFDTSDGLDHRLRKLILSKMDLTEAPVDQGERRLYGLFDMEEDCIQQLASRIFEAVQTYLGPQACEMIDEIELSGRALVIQDRAFINTHVDRDEADIVCTYFPTTDVNVDLPVNSKGNPTFVIEDPSRHLQEKRLPFEHRQSFFVAPRPGLLLVMPGHVPHNQHPYNAPGGEPHIQIVANIKLTYSDEHYLLNHG